MKDQTICRSNIFKKNNLLLYLCITHGKENAAKIIHISHAADCRYSSSCDAYMLYTSRCVWFLKYIFQYWSSASSQLGNVLRVRCPRWIFSRSHCVSSILYARGIGFVQKITHLGVGYLEFRLESVRFQWRWRARCLCAVMHVPMRAELIWVKCVLLLFPEILFLYFPWRTWFFLFKHTQTYQISNVTFCKQFIAYQPSPVSWFPPCQTTFIVSYMW